MTGSDNRLNFDQKSQRASMQVDYHIDANTLSHSFLSGYEYLYDSSSLEQELSAYQNKTGFLGYNAGLHLLPNLALSLGGKAYIRKEQDRYAADRFLDSDGHELNAALNASIDLGASNLGIKADIQAKKLDWEAYKQSTAGAWFNLDKRDVSIRQNINWDYREDDLYVLQIIDDQLRFGEYRLNDAQKRNSLSYNAYLEYQSPKRLHLAFSDNLSRRSIALKNNAVRSSEDLINQAILNLDYKLFPALYINTNISHNYAFKDFSFLGNTRSTEFRSLGGKIIWEYLPADSLFINASIDLQRTTYPQEQHRWDNDLLNRQIRLGAVYHYKQRMRIAALLGLFDREDVYLDGILSSNNKTIQGIFLQPECSVLIADRLAFKQNYLIRADYTDYIYGEKAGSVYRQLGYRYSLVFDSFPLIAHSNDPLWLLLPYRQDQDNAVLIEASFAYEQNEYADHRQDYYLIGNRNIRKTASLTLKHDISSFYVILEPSYSWGTWMRYSMLFGLACRFNNESLLELSINPVGDSLQDLDWKSTINLNLRF